MTNQEYQDLRQKCKDLAKTASTPEQHNELKRLREKRNTAHALQGRIIFNEGRIRQYQFIHDACNELSGKKQLWANRIILTQQALETARENFKNFS